MTKPLQTFLIAAYIVATNVLTAQNNVGIGTTSPNPAAVLDAYSTSQGFLPPRLTENQRFQIASPIPAGLIIWCTNCGSDGELQVYNGTIWTNMMGDTAAVASTIVSPQIGDYFAGGIIFWVAPAPIDIDGDGDLDNGLVCYPEDLKIETVAGTGIYNYAIKWGCEGSLITGADSHNVGAGAQNTLDILNPLTGCTEANIAAALCAAIPANGGNNWFLPSQHELLLLYTNLQLFGCTPSTPGYACPTRIGNLSLSYYWSSSERDANVAEVFNFSTGAGQGWNKDAGHFVRAIRAF